MPRATRYLQEGYIYHLTHRCLNGEFFLRFSRERDCYRKWLRVGIQRYRVPVLGYAITSNHVHVVVEAIDRLAVAALMKLAAGSVAENWNRRREREGSMWEHPYHCTKIQDGRHLLNCLCYVDLNMVRAGKVSHPRDWRWCSYDELTMQRIRYRIVNRDRLLALSGYTDMARFAADHQTRIEERLHRRCIAREPVWTEAVAVGDRRFVEEAQAAATYRKTMDLYEIDSDPDSRAWAVRETLSRYSTDSDPKTGL